MSSSFHTFSNDVEETARVATRSSDGSSYMGDEEVKKSTGTSDYIQSGSFGNAEEFPLDHDGGFHTDKNAEDFSDASPFSKPVSNGQAYGLEGNVGLFGPDGPILPEPEDMKEEGFMLREWRRQNAIHLEGKEKKEKEMRNQIIAEAEGFKQAFYKNRQKNCETNKTNNREKEKLFLTKHEKFHAEADKHYWKAIAEIIPNEVPNIEKRGKKDTEKKPSVMVLQGPKPGKPTDLSRLRNLLVKLKHNPPPHMKAPPPPVEETAKGDGNAARKGDDNKIASPTKEATSKYITTSPKEEKAQVLAGTVAGGEVVAEPEPATTKLDD